ncbi:hypothetical protein DFH09DRAFT_1368299 [Mycena vulgaris]|nr:hypothetical protein DFH09DRAFT_1368299 [Mycena vulgaris]
MTRKPQIRSAPRLSVRGYAELGGPAGVETLLSVAIVSTLSFGIYLALAVIALYLHALAHQYDASARGGALRSPVLLGIVALFLTITAHWVLTIVGVYSAFRQTAVPPALAFYQDPLPPVALVRNLFLFLSWSIGDLLIIQRLWTVWKHNRLVVVFPACTWLGLTASGIGKNVVSSLHYLEPTEIFPIVHGWFTSELVFTLCVLRQVDDKSTTVYCTAFFGFRIWNNQQRMNSVGGPRGTLMGLLANIVESAAIYTAWVIINVVSYQAQSSVNFWVFESSAGVVGAVNMLIYVRVGLEWVQRSHDRLVSTRLQSQQTGSTVTGDATAEGGNRDTELKGLRFHIVDPVSSVDI